MSIGGVLLGLINIAIVVVLLLLVGAVGWFILGKLGWSPGGDVRNLYIALVALIALYMIVALIFGLPTIRIMGG
jgi:hypothetical protein